MASSRSPKRDGRDRSRSESENNERTYRKVQAGAGLYGLLMLVGFIVTIVILVTAFTAS